MKKKIVFFVVFMAFVFTSCLIETESGKIIGDFRVIKKVSQKEKTGGFDRATDYGDVYLVSCSKQDTITIHISASTVYLNIRVSDILPVRKNRFGKYSIVKIGMKRDEVGYCKILSKTILSDSYRFSVLTRGRDTVNVENIPADIFFNPPADSIFVKKNTTLRIYYVR